MSRATRPLALAAALGFVAATPAAAQLRGHGGPVRAVAVAADGMVAASAGFDQSLILWALDRDAALEVLRFHDGAINAVATLPGGRFATGGEDGRIAIWEPGVGAPARVFEGHSAPVAALAVSPDGARLASASWDETIRVTPLGGGDATVLRGHQGNVNGVAFAPDGNTLVSAGYDATLRLWPLDRPGEPVILRLPAPLNAVAVAPDGGVASAGADGRVRLHGAEGGVRAEAEIDAAPVLALAIAPGGALVAAAGIRGTIALVERPSGAIARRLGDGGAPVWGVAFAPDGKRLLSAGGDGAVRRWDVATGRELGVTARPAAAAESGGDARGAEVFRACVACHALTPADGNRAGPTLNGVFGRRIATAPGYPYSPALRGMDIVWSAETIARLFEIGPSKMTPGTKMPEQIVGDPADREALVRFLARAAAPP